MTKPNKVRARFAFGTWWFRLGGEKFPGKSTMIHPDLAEGLKKFIDILEPNRVQAQ